MTPVRIALGLIVALFIGAEVARPTHIPTKKFSAHALVVRSQAAPGAGVYGSLDPNLLADLPRIHPDAMGDVRCSQQRDGSIRLFGLFHGGDDGSAVFAINDDVRLATDATVFAQPTHPHTFIIEIPPNDLGPGAHHLHVALVSSDERGFFLLPQTVALTVGTPSEESGDCPMRRRPLALRVVRALRANHERCEP